MLQHNSLQVNCPMSISCQSHIDSPCQATSTQPNWVIVYLSFNNSSAPRLVTVDSLRLCLDLSLTVPSALAVFKSIDQTSSLNLVPTCQIQCRDGNMWVSSERYLQNVCPYGKQFQVLIPIALL